MHASDSCASDQAMSGALWPPIFCLCFQSPSSTIYGHTHSQLYRIPRAATPRGITKNCSHFDTKINVNNYNKVPVHLLPLFCEEPLLFELLIFFFSCICTTSNDWDWVLEICEFCDPLFPDPCDSCRDSCLVTIWWGCVGGDWDVKSGGEQPSCSTLDWVESDPSLCITLAIIFLRWVPVFMPHNLSSCRKGGRVKYWNSWPI